MNVIEHLVVDVVSSNQIVQESLVQYVHLYLKLYKLSPKNIYVLAKQLEIERVARVLLPVLKTLHLFFKYLI
jgi:hypothetical protein